MDSESQKPGCRRSRNTTAGKPCDNGPHWETDPKDASITAVQFHQTTPEHNKHIGDGYSTDFIAWRRLEVCIRNDVIHIRSDHIVRRMITFHFWKSCLPQTMTNQNLFYDIKENSWKGLLRRNLTDLMCCCSVLLWPPCCPMLINIRKNELDC